MNSQLGIVILVDVENALTEKTLSGNCYFVDNNRYAGSTGEGSGRLVTMVNGNQILNWLVFPLDVFNATGFAYLANVSGDAVEKGVIVPQVFESPEFDTRGLWWGASVGANVAGEYRYTLTINVSGVDMDVDAFIHYKRAFSNFETTRDPVLSHLPDLREYRTLPMARPRDL